MKNLYRVALAFSAIMAVALLASANTYFSGNGQLKNVIIAITLFGLGISTALSVKRKMQNETLLDAVRPPDSPNAEEVPGEQTQEKTFMDAWEENLAVVWEGEEEIAFSYESNDGRKSRRTVTLHRVLRNENNAVYFRGFCHLRNEERTFADAGITSKITYKSKRYDWEDFVEQRLGVKLDA